jgi:hypothetical protein
MAFLTKKDFAAKCGGKATNWLSIYISRGKVVVDSSDLIDTLHEKNVAFLQKWGAPETEPPASAPPKPKKPVKVALAAAGDEEDEDDIEEELDEDGERIRPYGESERVFKHHQAEKERKNSELLDLKIQKQKGQVIPSAIMVPVFLQHNQSITTAFKNGTDEILRRFTKMKDLAPDEAAELKGYMVKIINDAVGKATEATVASVKTIINDFSEKRGVGERS